MPKAKNKEFEFVTEIVLIADLTPHPRNYKSHPKDQLDELIVSIKEHGFYRNIVISKDNVILAGHGMVLAATKMGLSEVPVKRLGIASDHPRALKLLVADNELSHLAMSDDRMLSNLLKEINDVDISGLLGTGYDQKMLANLAMVTRPEAEVKDFDAAAHWLGMPEYGSSREEFQLVITFENEALRDELMKLINVSKTSTRLRKTWSCWWPERDQEDTSSLKFKA